MSEHVSWYACKRDLGITIIISIVTALSLPILLKGWVDSWPLTTMYIAMMVFIESLLVCYKHIWYWTIISAFSITFGFFIGRDLFFHPVSYFTFDFQDLFLNGLFFLASSIPLVTLVFVSRKGPRQIGIYLLLIPIAWFVGFAFSDSYYKLTIAFRETVWNTAIFLALLAVGIFIRATLIARKTVEVRKYTHMQVSSVVAWLFAGIIPGIMGLGWKFSLLATVLPAIVIYHYFELEKLAIRSRQ